MKKIIIALIVIQSAFSYAQEIEKKENKDKKIYLGIHYIGNLGDNGIINNGYKGIIGLDAKYVFLNKENIDLNAGISFDYFQPKNSFFSKNIIIFNPNIGVAFKISNSIFNPYFNAGYGFFSYKIDIEDLNPQEANDPGLQGFNLNRKFGGLTANPGFKLHISNTFFFDANYKYFAFKSNEIEGNVATHFVNIGLGIKLL